MKPRIVFCCVIAFWILSTFVPIIHVITDPGLPSLAHGNGIGNYNGIGSSNGKGNRNGDGNGNSYGIYNSNGSGNGSGNYNGSGNRKSIGNGVSKKRPISLITVQYVVSIFIAVSVAVCANSYTYRLIKRYEWPILNWLKRSFSVGMS